jgi:hypothetical protein
MKWDKNQISKKNWPLIFTETLQIAKFSKTEKAGPNDPAFFKAFTLPNKTLGQQ